MTLVPIHSPKPEVSVYCCRCHQPVRNKNVLADLDGIPFHSYYCQLCAAELSS